MKRAGAVPLVIVLVAACGGRATPAPVPHPMPTSIVASEVGTCVSFADHPPTCWGPLVLPAVARPLVEAEDAIDIALGSCTACVVRPDGRVSCWGDHGHIANVKDTPLADVAGVTDARAVRVGGSFACALRTTGVVTCWGIAGVEFPPTDLSQLPGGVIELSVGSAFGCVRTASGTVECWGRDSFGELGDGRSTAMFRYEPVAPLGLPAAAAIATGELWACALLTTADVWCWGKTPTGDILSPSPVPGLSDVEQIAVGATSACAVRRDGSVVCWGMNEGGVVAYEQMSFASPVPIRGLPPASLVAVGQTYACAIARDGDVWCWGTSYGGHLGTGQLEQRAPPLRVAL